MHAAGLGRRLRLVEQLAAARAIARLIPILQQYEPKMNVTPNAVALKDD